MKYLSLLLWSTTMTVLFMCHSHAQHVPMVIFGYTDLVLRDFGEREYPSGARENPPPSFVMLRTHLLLNSTFAENWRAFVNLRFRSGGHLGSSSDHTDKGEIQLLEAWFEYRHSERLQIRGGQFLAPFGYFNTKKFHSPIFNTVVLPVMYEEEFLRRAAATTIIPPAQNLQLSGEIYPRDWRLRYNLYVGNGTTTDENSLDVNANKSVGARILAEPPKQNLTVGASFFAEKGIFPIRPYFDRSAIMMAAQSLNVEISSVTPILPIVTEKENRRTLGLDARYHWRELEVRGEFVKSRISDLSLVDASAVSDTTRTYQFEGSSFSKSFFYIQVNSTFQDKWTPFVELNVFEDPRHYTFRNTLTRWTGGISFRPTSNVLLKAEAHTHQFGTKFNKKPNEFKSFQMYWSAVSVFFN